MTNKSVILVQFENNWIIYGIHNTKEPNVLLNLKNSIDNNYICVDRKSQTPFVLINRNNQINTTTETQFYSFLYPYKDNGIYEYQAIKKILGKTLLINLESASANSLEELELTVTHEAMHLFGQDKIQFAEPIYKFNLINENQLIGKEQSPDLGNTKCELQQSIIDKYSGREYLQYKEKCHSAFQKSVIHEICLNLNLLKFIVQTKNIKDIDNKLHAIFLFKEIFKEIENRSSIDGEDSFALEWYWYLMEGVPQYMEQKILIEKNPVRLLSQYESYCEQRNGYQEYFYPLLTGAAVWHALEYLFESTDEWDHLARQAEYNIITTENSKSWLGNFHQLINNKINQINLK